MRIFFEKYGAVLVLILIMAASFIIKSWNFREGMYFMPDQSRDALVTREAFERGPGYLPLLGPKAGGTFLHLGPAFYYIQYLSALTAGNFEPHSLAYPELIFSILAIFLFYLLTKNRFSQSVQLMMLALYGVSFMLVQYARFAWNPNQMPFWTLLFSFSLYRVVNAEVPKKGGMWLLVAAFSYGVASQLHFLAFLGFPVVGMLFLFFFFPRQINWKWWIGALLVILALYAPVFISDYLSKGNNFAHFMYALNHKGEQGSFGANIQKAVFLYGREYAMFFTAVDFKKNIYAVSAIIFMMLVALGISGWKWLRGEGKEDKSFYGLVMVWFLVYAFLYTKLANSLEEPRFWLITIHLPFIFFAIILEKALHFSRWLAYGLTAVLIFSNGYATFAWYQTLAYPEQGFSKLEKFQLKQDNGVTVAAYQQVASKMEQAATKEAKGACFLSLGGFEAPLKYIYLLQYPQGYMKRMDADDPAAKCMFFVVALTQKKEEDVLKLLGEGYRINKVEQAGVFKLWHVGKQSLEIDKNFEEQDLKEYFQKEALEDEFDGRATFETLDSAVQKTGSAQGQEPIHLQRILWKDVR
jgi:4-amino-4-deoxy-L-arabinose transferase-like glycosyltransferase